MNSQFKNSNLGFYLYAFLIIVIAAAVVFIFWFMRWGWKMGTYPENTMLGSVYVGGLREEEIEGTMTTRIDRWLGDETIVFEATYQGYTYEFDRELFYFDVEASIDTLNDGMGNQLNVTFIPDAQETVLMQLDSLDFLQDVKENIDFDKLINDVLNDASQMKSFSSNELEDYFLDIELSTNVLDETTIYVPNGISVDDFIFNINNSYDSGRVLIKEQELFDVMTELGEVLEDNELTVLSLGMYELILGTNFSINEVHYQNTLNEYSVDLFPFFGHNTKVFERENESFSFYNPNDSEYYFTVEKEDINHVTIKLYGLDFVNTIEVTDDEDRMTIIPFTSKVGNFDEDRRDGVNGVMIEMYRVIYDVDGNVLSNKLIVFEFYPPEVEITVAP